MIRIGVIGCGHWGPNYVRNLEALKGVSVKVVCDASEERLMSMGSSHKSLQLVRDPGTVLGDPGIDAVVVATPARTHYDLCRRALVEGKHVLVEKPFTLDLSEGKKLIDVAARRRKVLMVAHTFLYNPAVRKLKQYMQRGTLGRIYYLHSTRTNLGPIRRDVSAMWDLAPHDISIFSYLLGVGPVQVSARGETYLQHGKEDVAFLTLTYPGKVIASIHVSWLDPRKVREITVIGDRKMAVFDDLGGAWPIRVFDKQVMRKKYRHDYATFGEFNLIVKDGKEVTLPVRLQEPLECQCRHFLECIRKGRSPLSDGSNGLSVLRVLLAAERSLAQRGRPVTIR